MTRTYPATDVLEQRLHVGTVASGDLEIVVTPALASDCAQVTVRSTVDGYDLLWQRVLDREVGQAPRRAIYRINDAGATPGMVRLRFAQIRRQMEGGLR
ncbi:malonate decarboxylase acyl carrier protein [Nocardia sp. NPDC005825]